MKSEADREKETNWESGKKSEQPPLYQVSLKYDDFTPREFMLDILERFFYMDRRRAAEVMLETHTKGSGICGIFSKDFAESKISQVVEHARLHDHPLACSMETAS